MWKYLQNLLLFVTFNLFIFFEFSIKMYGHDRGITDKKKIRKEVGEVRCQ